MRHKGGLMAAVNVRISSHCLHFETVCSLRFWGCHWYKIKPNPAMMTNITKFMWKDSPRGSIKSTSGELALCANYHSSIFTVSPRCLQRWQVSLQLSFGFPPAWISRTTKWLRGYSARCAWRPRQNLHSEEISQVSSLLCSLKTMWWGAVVRMLHYHTSAH